MAHLRSKWVWSKKRAVAVRNFSITHLLFCICMLVALATIIPAIHNDQFSNPFWNDIIHFIAWLAAIYLLYCFVKYLPDKQLFKSLTEKIRKVLRRLGWYELPTRWQLIFIFIATLFGLYGFYALFYTKNPDLRQTWHYIFDWVFPSLNESVLEDIPCIELGVSFYAVGVLLLGQHKTAPFPEWNPYDLKVLKYSTKISPCATAYLAGLFFAAYTGTHRWAFICTLALFFTQLSVICFEHDLPKDEVQQKVARFACSSITTTLKNRDSTLSIELSLYQAVCKEFAFICNHAISYQATNENKPFRYSDIAKDIVGLANAFLNSLNDFKDLDGKMLELSIGYAMLGCATQENSDKTKIQTFYKVLYSNLQHYPYMSLGLLLRICSFEKKGVNSTTIEAIENIDASFKMSVLQSFLNSGALPNADEIRKLQEQWLSKDTTTATAATPGSHQDVNYLNNIFTDHLSENDRPIIFADEGSKKDA